MRDHKRFDAFALADSLVLAIYASTTGFPLEERFGLVTQMRRASVSTAANIVEGSARISEKDFARFLDIAFSSARELGYFIDLAGRLGYLASEDLQRLTSLQGRTCAAVAGLRKALGT